MVGIIQGNAKIAFGDTSSCHVLHAYTAQHGRHADKEYAAQSHGKDSDGGAPFIARQVGKGKRGHFYFPVPLADFVVRTVFLIADGLHGGNPFCQTDRFSQGNGYRDKRCQSRRKQHGRRKHMNLSDHCIYRVAGVGADGGAVSVCTQGQREQKTGQQESDQQSERNRKDGHDDALPEKHSGNLAAGCAQSFQLADFLHVGNYAHIVDAVDHQSGKEDYDQADHGHNGDPFRARIGCGKKILIVKNNMGFVQPDISGDRMDSVCHFIEGQSFFPVNAQCGVWQRLVKSGLLIFG